MTADNVRKVRQVGIGWSAVSVPTPHPIDDRVQEAGLPRNVQLWVPTLSSMVAVVAGSDFVAYMARGAAGRFAETYGIALHRLPFELRPLPMIMVWHESFEADCGHRWLRDTIRDICRSI